MAKSSKKIDRAAPSSSETLAKPAPDLEQRNLIVRELDRTMLVEAAAGTGKTTSMIARMVALLAAGKCRVDTLAAVTFTRKAAAEIRSRFQLELERAAQQSDSEQRAHLRTALEHVERCFVGTIHSFCARLLRERPVEANVDVAFQEIDEAADWTLREQAWREHVQYLLAADSPIVSELEEKGMKLKIWQRTRRQDPIIGELEELGLEVARMGPAFMTIAGFPDVLEWPALGVALPDFTDAYAELREYVKHIRTLLSGLTEDPGRDDLIPKYRQVARMMNYVDIEKPAGLVEVLSQFTELKDRAVIQRNWPRGIGKSELAKWNDFARRWAQPVVKAWREHCYEPILRAMLPARDIYDRLRRENNQLNFQDLLLKAVELLRDKPQIRHYFRKRFTHLLVDEFQDTDPIQAEVMLLLTATDVQEINWQKCRPVDGSLFVVGDPKQSIYRFRRADIVTYTKVKRIISDAGGLIVPLSANFRTVEPVIDWINSKFQGTFPEKATNYSPERHALQPGRTDGEQADLLGIRQLQIPAEESSSEVRVAQYESELIARTIRHALDSGLTVPRTDREREAGVPPQARPEDFLIIARTKKRLSLYGQKLQEYGIPHQVTGGSTVNEVGELQLLNLCLRAITRPDDQVALLAALRSQLFGISDVALYDFKRAGGVFSFQVPVPDQTPAEAKALFADAFARLQQYARWLAKLPSISAIEKITADLGLWAFSCTGIDGSLQAGSLGKGLELLRDASHAGAVMAADLVELLGKIIDQDQSHDGLPALPEQDSPVRVMNLHQAKGLEAAVVFLVYPNGPGPFGPEIHIDRTGDRALGYLMIMGEAGERRQRPILAHPVGWDGFSQEEDAFLKAENDRLLYVAATRAGSQLTISQRTQRNDSNPWLPFQEAIRGCPNADLPDSPVSRPKPTRIVPLGDVANAAADTVTRWEKVSAVSYGVVSAKDWALSGPVPKKPRSAGEHGTEWGTVIHTLLEAAVSRPHSDLRNLALSSLIEQDLDPNLADTAVETVQAITRSELWTRVQASSKKFVEIPFETLISNPESPTPVPTLMRGVIDLVFREKPGWVIVDYKTEQVPEESLAELASHYSSQIHTYARVWEQMVGEAIHETGIFFTHSRQYYRYVS